MKKGGFSKKWLRRYFVLYRTCMGHIICYYADHTETVRGALPSAFGGGHCVCICVSVCPEALWAGAGPSVCVFEERSREFFPPFSCWCE
jgi:hypothetical protein